MSRDIGSNSSWDTAGWDSVPSIGPASEGGQSTWMPQPFVTDYITQFLADPDPAGGVSIGPKPVGGLRLIVQAMDPSLGGTALWDVGHWDVDEWNASVGQWRDISAYVRGLHWRNGQSSPTARADVGDGTVTLKNRDGLTSPWATSGLFTFGGNSWIKAGLLIRWGIMCTDIPGLGSLPGLNAFNSFFTGRVETVQEQTAENVDGWVDLTIVETTAELRGVPDDEVYPAQSAASGVFNAALGAGWQYQRDMQAPRDDVPTDNIIISGKSSMERAQFFADCRHFDVIANGRGQLMLVERKHADGASGIVFSNDPTNYDTTLGTLCPMVTAQPYSTTERIINDVIAQGDTAAGVNEVQDLPSQNQHGIISHAFDFPRTDLPMDSARITSLIQLVLNRRSRDDQGIASVDLHADQDTVHMPAIMTYIAAYARGNPSFNVHWFHPSGLSLKDIVVIEGQTHDITMEGGQILWTATLDTGGI